VGGGCFFVGVGVGWGLCVWVCGWGGVGWVVCGWGSGVGREPLKRRPSSIQIGGNLYREIQGMAVDGQNGVPLIRDCRESSFFMRKSREKRLSHPLQERMTRTRIERGSGKELFTLKRSEEPEGKSQGETQKRQRSIPVG